MTTRSGLHPNKSTSSGIGPKQPFFLKPDKAAAQNKFFSSKLTIGKPNDKYEKEADSMADRVVGTLGEAGSPALQRKCALCEAEEKVQPKAEEEENIQKKSEEDEEDVQLKSEEDEEDVSVQKKAVSDREEEAQLQSEGVSNTPNSSLSMQLGKSNGRGMRLPRETKK